MVNDGHWSSTKPKKSYVVTVVNTSQRKSMQVNASQRKSMQVNASQQMSRGGSWHKWSRQRHRFSSSIYSSPSASNESSSKARLGQSQIIDRHGCGWVWMLAYPMVDLPWTSLGHTAVYPNSTLILLATPSSPSLHWPVKCRKWCIAAAAVRSDVNDQDHSAFS